MTQLKKLKQLDKIFLEKFGLVMNEIHRLYWGARCVLELQYAYELSRSENGEYDKILFDAIDIAWEAYKVQGAITDEATSKVERILKPISKKAKSYSLNCVGHAHIDMNWMWGYDETVMVTVDTFRTMLDLMNEYPEFTFGQSQASVYRIVEEHCPDMIEEIKRRVHEGRWEVTASTWVEADRNMPNLESMARNLMYTKQYLSGLLDIDPATLNIDYEPDTFGHNINVPEVLCDGGVKYYYHCRGFDKHVLYNWKAPSGRQILVFREPTWYNWPISGHCTLRVPEFCKKHGLNSMLRVYGVGDHGGGPTRRDIEKIIDMNKWPIFPEFRFGTYGEFYRLAEQKREIYPTVEGELNFIFDGCYTTQARQKMGNRLGEKLLVESESVSALANLAADAKYNRKAFLGAWEKVMFNQFHDILPGSGTVETREYAMGKYQEAFAAANINRTLSIRTLSDMSDTSAFAVEEDVAMTRSEGAGVGYGVSSGDIAQLGRHSGIRRIFTVYNSMSFKREGLAHVTVWDWQGEDDCMVWTDANGRKLDHQVITNGYDNYWGHLHADVLVKVEVPAMGYTTIVLDETDPTEFKVEVLGPKVDECINNVLENEYLRAELDSRDGSIISLVDKKAGFEFVKRGCPLGIFRLVEEDTSKGMSAWWVGQYRNVFSLNKGVKLKDIKTGSKYIRQSITYEIEFGNNSKIQVTVSLDNDETILRFDATVNWQEIGNEETFFPQLNFFMPVAYDYSTIRYDVPMGTIERQPMDMDVPAQSYGMPINGQGTSLMLISDSKYGYRGTKEGLSLTLIRSSVEPDPWPEIGKHRIQMAIAMCDGDRTANIDLAHSFCRGFMVTTAKAHKGKLPPTQSLVELSDNVILSALKIAEDGGGIIVRYYEIEGKSGSGEIRIFKEPAGAEAVNVLEQKVNGDVRVQGDTVTFGYRAYGVGSMKIMF